LTAGQKTQVRDHEGSCEIKQNPYSKKAAPLAVHQLIAFVERGQPDAHDNCNQASPQKIPRVPQRRQRSVSHGH